MLQPRRGIGRPPFLRFFSLSPVSVSPVPLWFVSEGRAQTAFPMVTHPTPVAVQRGKTTEVVVAGQQDFRGVYKALFEGTGITAEVVPQPAPKAPPKGK